MPMTLHIVDKNSTIWCLHPDCLLDIDPFKTRQELYCHTALYHDNDQKMEKQCINIGNELVEKSINIAIEKVKSTSTEIDTKPIEKSHLVEKLNPRRFYWLSRPVETSLSNDWIVLAKQQKELLCRLDSLYTKC